VTDPSSKLASFVPLELALRYIFNEVYGSVSSPDELNGLAMAVAALATIYQSENESTKVARVIPAPVAYSGTFRGSGKELRFVDGRAALTSLCVKAEDIAYVVGMLRQGLAFDDPAANSYTAPTPPPTDNQLLSFTVNAAWLSAYG
jgi:hypothetical protein